MVRKVMVTLTLLGPACAFGFLVANPNPSPTAATVLSTVAVGMLGFGDSGYWAAYVDMSPKYAGILLGCGNTVGNFAGILVNLSTGMILDAYTEDLSAGWTVVFTTQIAVTCCGWVGFTLFYPSEGGVLIR